MSSSPGYRVFRFAKTGSHRQDRLGARLTLIKVNVALADSYLS